MSVYYDPTKHTVADVIQFFINSSQGQNNSFKLYRSWPKLFAMDEAPHIWDVRSYDSRAHNKRQYTFAFVFYKDKSTFTQFKKDLDLALSFSPSRTDRDGNMVFDVFDRFLSEYGNSVRLVCIDDETWKVTNNSGRSIVEGSLEECYQYLVEHRWYTDEEDDEGDL